MALLHSDDILACILRCAPEILGRLARVDRTLRGMLKDRADMLAYERLLALDGSSSIFRMGREWCQFNALYAMDRRSVRRWIGGRRVMVRKHRFGFYTGRRDEWHHCVLMVPPYGTGRGARLRVESYETFGDLIVKRTFGGICCVAELVWILEHRYWHSCLWMWSSRWSYLEGRERQALVVGYEE